MTFDIVGFCCAAAGCGSASGSMAAAHMIPATATDFRRTILIAILHFVQSARRAYHSRAPLGLYIQLNAQFQRSLASVR